LFEQPGDLALLLGNAPCLFRDESIFFDEELQQLKNVFNRVFSH
jgi:hypothetical protein